MSPQVRSRLASIVTTLILAYIFYRVLDRLFIVIWVQVPWWGLILLAIALYLIIDHLVRRAFNA
ncbi:MAG: hypothetical protein U0175_32800 [Caldilineaceae bacterium]